MRQVVLLFFLAVAAAAAQAQAQSNLVIDDYPRYGTALDAAKQERLRGLAREIASDLRAQARVSVVVHGHADFDAKGAAFETQVSQERANAAAAELRRLLIEEGGAAGIERARLDTLRIDAIGHGTSQALFRNPTMPQRLKNRRVEMVKTAVPGPGPEPVAGLTPQHLASPLYRFHLEASRRGHAITAAPSPAGSDPLTVYAEECRRATGISLPEKISCLDGEEVPGQEFIKTGPNVAGPCKTPNVLNGECDPGSHFQVLKGRTADAVAVAHCRKVGLPANQPRGSDFYSDIAIIQYNKKNGAICFYQALATQGPDPINLPGTDIPSPAKGSSTPWGTSRARWFTPQVTASIGCTACHDNGGFLRSPYIMQTSRHKLPSEAEGFDNSTIPLRYVGAAFANQRSWQIDTSSAPGDTGMNCNSCHRLAVSNHFRIKDAIADPADRKKQVGTAFTMAPRATAATQDNKLPHSRTSPIWMRPGQVTYHKGAEDTARRFKECAERFANGNFTASPAGCTMTPLGQPFTAPSP